MRPLNLLFKKFRQSKALQLVSKLLLFSALASCQGPAFFSGSTPLHFFRPREPVSIGTSVGGEFVEFGKVPVSACTGDKVKQINIKMNSPIGDHSLSFIEAKKPDQTNVFADGARLALPIRFVFDAQTFSKICKQGLNSEKYFLNDQQIEALALSIHRSTPSCELNAPEIDDSWHCTIADIKAETGLWRIAKLHRDLIKKFRRHPYLLARRISVTYNLAAALNKRDPVTALQNTCRVIRSSLSDELPIILTNPKWRKMTCSSLSQTDVLGGARFGLKYSLDEVNRSLELLGKKSHRGVLSIKFPESKIPARDLLVKLRPKSLQNFPIDTLYAGQCWNPIFSNQKSYLRGSSLGFLKPSTCQPIANSAEWQSAVGYLFSSISSESEFVMSNGRGKILRLPEGEYHYNILSNQDETQKNQTSSKGLLNWSRKGPSPLLKKW